jgi:simple sugar transport system permease protein
MGADGQFFIGASAATAAGIFLDLPPVIHSIVALACGILAGALAGFVPGILKSRWGASELVSSLMLNYVLVKLGMYLVTYPLRDPDIGALASRQVLPSSWLTQFIPSTRLHTGIMVLILTVVFCYYFLYRSKWGYETRMLGQNPGFAMYSGMSVAAANPLHLRLIGRLSAGLAGAVEILAYTGGSCGLAQPVIGF